MKLNKIYIPILLGLSISLGIGMGSFLNFSQNSGALFTNNAKKEKLNKLIDYIDYEYVDAIIQIV